MTKSRGGFGMVVPSEEQFSTSENRKRRSPSERHVLFLLGSCPVRSRLESGLGRRGAFMADFKVNGTPLRLI